LADTLKAVPSYNWRGQPETFNFLDQVYGDKNIYTTARDLLIWDRALASGLIFNEETLNEAYAPYSNEKPGLRNYGLGWRMNIFPDGNKIIYHNGWWHGKVLTSLFGNYYVPVEEEENITAKDSVKISVALLKTDSTKISGSKKIKHLTDQKKDSTKPEQH
jgi:CubicO group peptidase (beta-lactamase class C family)